MSKLSIYENSWLDLVFEGKNKEYGAYQLRRDTDKTTAMAFGLGLLFVSLLACIPLAINLITGKSMSQSVPVEIDKIIEVTNIFQEPKKPQSAIVPIQKKQYDPETKERLHDPEIVKENEATQNIAENKDPQTTNIKPVDGTPTGASAENPTNGGGAAGNNNAPSEEGPVIAATLDKMPEFPGGIEKFYKYVGKNFNNPETDEAKTLKVYVSFVIEKDGSMTDIQVKRDPGYGLGREAIRVLKSLKTKWEPGILNGKPVRTAYNLPITVQIQ